MTLTLFLSFFFIIFFIWENEDESLIWTTFKELEHEYPWALHTANHTTTAYTQGFKWLMVSLLSKMTVIQELVTEKTPVSLSLGLTDILILGRGLSVGRKLRPKP